MPEGTRDVHCLLQHDHAEWNARDPRDETDDAENREDEEHHGGGIVMPVEVVYGGSDAEHDLQNARDPDELLRERPRGEEVGPREDEGGCEDEDEEEESIGVEREAVWIVVYAVAAQGFLGSVPLEGETGDGHESKESEDELRVRGSSAADLAQAYRRGDTSYQDSGPEVVVAWFL